MDDDPGVREALGRLLRSADFTAVVFSSAEDVLQSGFLASASCLISDLRMPGMQGLELRRMLKRDYPELPVLLITGHREEGIESGSLFDGKTRLFYKPLDLDEFLKAISSAIFDSPQNENL